MLVYLNLRDSNMGSESTFIIWRLLNERGPPEFGLIAQVLLAITFKGLGAAITSLKQTGHPDIEFFYQDKNWKAETEFVAPSRDTYDIKQEDLEATRSGASVNTGIISILDCNYPVKWIIVNSQILCIEGIRRISLLRLRSICEKELSKSCTDWIDRFVQDNKDSIFAMKYTSLRDHFLLGE